MSTANDGLLKLHDSATKEQLINFKEYQNYQNLCMNVFSKTI